MRYQPLPKSAGLNLGTDLSGSSGMHFESPVPSTHDRDAIGVKWNAHDENDDQLVYSVYYRGDGETRWLLLKDNLTDKAYSFDASLLPDGGYTVKVVASDAPVALPRRRADRLERKPPLRSRYHSAAHRESHGDCRGRADPRPLPRRRWILHHQARRIFHRRRRVEICRARRASSPMRRLKTTTSRPPWTPPKNTDAAEHVVVVRVYDKYDNMGAAKTVLKAK